MAKMNPSKLRNVLAELPYCNLSSTKKDAIDTIITKYLTGEIVSVVRCRDCGCFNASGTGDGCGFCFAFYDEVKEDGFCSYGERKDNA